MRINKVVQHCQITQYIIRVPKHIDIKYYFTLVQIENKIVCLKYSPTGEQEANFLTISFPPPQFHELREKMGCKHNKKIEGVHDLVRFLWGFSLTHATNVGSSVVYSP
ncbi:hypothetical protein WA026_020964 [Henosepilachna vigintioctopunctata]|uniref:LAGLIDADG homing endonuclease n=1 Tax=Henosepilachna vigintioctopunctata TaxID=420089 RepID=A0AAW1VHF6_9CUCU